MSGIHNLKDEFNDADISSLISAGSLGGGAQNGSVTCNPANSWVELPSAAPSGDYLIVFITGTTTGTTRFAFIDDGTPGAGNGVPLLRNIYHAYRMASGQQIFVASTVNTDTIEYTYKLL